MHRKLALKFAAWLSPEFELWVYDRIEELLLEAKQVEEPKEPPYEMATVTVYEPNTKYQIAVEQLYDCCRIEQKSVRRKLAKSIYDNL